MFNAIVEEEEENSEIEIDDDKSKELKEKLARVLKIFLRVKRNTYSKFEGYSNEATEKEVKLKNQFGVLEFLELLFQ